MEIIIAAMIFLNISMSFAILKNQSFIAKEIEEIKNKK